MEKIMIVAHPNDEILWFNPEEFDHIYIAYGKSVPENHPLKDRITCWGIPSSGYEDNKSKEIEFRDSFDLVLSEIKKILKPDMEFWTHNPWGEYGHCEHILIHEAVMEIAERFGLSVFCFNGIQKDEGLECIEERMNMELLEKIFKVYDNKGLWKSEGNYTPKIKNKYYKII